MSSASSFALERGLEISAPLLPSPRRRRLASSLGRTIPVYPSILLRLAPDRGTGWILHLEPVGRAAGAIGRILPLRHDTFEPEPRTPARVSVKGAFATAPRAAMRLAFAVVILRLATACPWAHTERPDPPRKRRHPGENP